MAKIEFEVGDIVYLNSGSPRLTVVAVNGNDVTVSWHLTADPVSHTQSGIGTRTYPASCLTLYQVGR